MEKSLLASFILLTLFFQISSPVLPPETILDAVEILSDSGYLAMSLTLQLVSQTLISQSSPITVFAPSDDVFKDVGQPPLNLLQYHFSPEKFSIESLRSLPFGTEIPTLFKNHTLIVTTTTSDQEISLNNVTINGSAIFDVGVMVVYGINKFFDLNFTISPTSTPSVQNSTENLGCVATQFADYSEIVNKLLHTQYSAIGDFLDLQLLGFGDETKLTIFAPDDDELHDRLTNFTDFGSIFRRHVVPCKLTWQDLVNLEDEAELPTFLKGFNLKISKSGDVLVLNGVPVVFPEVYSGERVVIHGIEKLLELNDQQGLKGDSFSGFHSNSAGPVLDDGSKKGKIRIGLVAFPYLPKITHPKATVYVSNDCAFGLMIEKPLTICFEAITGRLGQVPACGLSYIRLQLNRTPTVVASNLCYPWIAVNNIMINGSVLDDVDDMGYYWTGYEYYDPSYKMSTNLLPEKIPLSHFRCVAQFADYHLASYAIKGIGGSFMSSFLDLQLVEIGENSKLTVFAPVSWKYDPYFGVPAAAFTFGNNYIFEYLKHVIPCKLTWKDLMNLEEGTLFHPLNSLVNSLQFKKKK
ncbi:Fasciclin domain-containing protein [Thalictrum thalictroides]|uniref:Fasciclin domain-containing protein n=1 Tax=Thalictrum thalictroides TaxID=46969 RepID=A0A7J6V781_THATH|nr:Fasciclin domain-containing protein [Thalictrum thalictroides]